MFLSLIYNASAAAVVLFGCESGLEATGARNATPGQSGIYQGLYDGSNGVHDGKIGTATPATPTLILTATPQTVAAGDDAQLQWTANHVSFCDASDGWLGRLETSGTQMTRELLQDTMFTLTCDGANGSVSESVTVTVSGGPLPPTVTLNAIPSAVNAGSSTRLVWSSTNASECTASGAWNGSVATSGAEVTSALVETSTFTLGCTGAGGSASASTTVTVSGDPPPDEAAFTRITIDTDQAPWGKNFADVDGDGFLDILEGGGALGNDVYWYRYPDWQRFRIGGQSGGDDLQTGDINGDGALDVVVNATPIAWYENPAGSGGNPQHQWSRRTVADHRSHDIALADVDRDGKLDIAVRMAGPGASPSTRIYLQNSGTSWTSVALHADSNGTGGLALADIDDDGRIDVVGDGYWLRQPATNPSDGDRWLRYTIGSWPAGSSIDTGDIDQDGNLDVTLAVSEVGTGDLAWFEAPDDPLTQSWIRHSVATVEDVHRHHLVDINNDGDLDIVFAEMHQSDTDRVGVYNNDGDGTSWTLQVLATHASHNIAIGDVGNDGDLDILGANWQLSAPGGGDVFLWRSNLTD